MPCLSHTRAGISSWRLWFQGSVVLVAATLLSPWLCLLGRMFTSASFGERGRGGGRVGNRQGRRGGEWALVSHPIILLDHGIATNIAWLKA